MKKHISSYYVVTVLIALAIGGAGYFGLKYEPALEVVGSVDPLRRECEKQEANTTSNKPVVGGTSQRQGATIAEDRSAAKRRACETVEHDESDLRAQWSSARATNNATEISKFGYRLSVLNFIALLVTLGAAFWAAHEARKSADAALDTLRSNRAWMISPECSLTNSNHSGNWNGLEILVKWKNCGNSPALKANCSHNYRLIPSANSDIPIFPAPVTAMFCANIGPGESFFTGTILLPPSLLTAFLAGTEKMFIYSIISYVDIFERERIRTSEVCYVVTCNYSSGSPVFTAVPMGEHQNKVT